jgi:hypothetical protein
MLLPLHAARGRGSPAALGRLLAAEKNVGRNVEGVRHPDQQLGRWRNAAHLVVGDRLLRHTDQRRELGLGQALCDPEASNPVTERLSLARFLLPFPCHRTSLEALGRTNG